MNVKPHVKLDLSKVHFCHEDRVKYRTHLTVFMVVATGLGLVGATLGIGWLGYASTVMHTWTAIIWIWE